MSVIPTLDGTSLSQSTACTRVQGQGLFPRGLPAAIIGSRHRAATEVRDDLARADRLVLAARVEGRFENAFEVLEIGQPPLDFDEPMLDESLDLPAGWGRASPRVQQD